MTTKTVHRETIAAARAYGRVLVDEIASDDLHERLPEYADEAIRHLTDEDLARLAVTVRRCVGERTVRVAPAGGGRVRVAKAKEDHCGRLALAMELGASVAPNDRHTARITAEDDHVLEFRTLDPFVAFSFAGESGRVRIWARTERQALGYLFEKAREAGCSIPSSELTEGQAAEFLLLHRGVSR